MTRKILVVLLLVVILIPPLGIWFLSWNRSSFFGYKIGPLQWRPSLALAVLPTMSISGVQECRSFVLPFVSFMVCWDADNMFTAAWRGDIEDLERHLANGEDVNAVDMMGITPLFRAVWVGHVNTVRWLLEHGAKVDVVTRMGEGVLNEEGFRPRWKIVELLLENGAPAPKNYFFAAATQGRAKVIHLMLEDGFDPNAVDKDGKTALEIATEWKRENVVSILEPLTKHENP